MPLFQWSANAAGIQLEVSDLPIRSPHFPTLSE